MDTITLCKKLLSYRTTSDKHEELVSIINFVEKYVTFASPNIFIKRFNHNNSPSILFTRKNSLKITKLLLGHLDVVPGEIKNFTPRVKGGKIYGRGTCDMKGVDAAMINAFISTNTNENVALYLSTDEEVGGEDGAGYLSKLKDLSYKSIYVPDSMPDYTLTIGQKGFEEINLIATGKPAHGSEPWLGENAIEILMDNAIKIKSEFDKHFISNLEGRDMNKPTMNIGMIKGGTAINQVPSSAYLTLDIRYFEEKEKNEFLNLIKNLAKKSSNIRVSRTMSGNPISLSLENEMILAFIKVLKLNKIKYKIGKELGSSDARFFAKCKGCIMFTPICGGAHEDIEWINIDSLKKFEKITKDYIRMNVS